jgi:serine/threonine protein kinase
MELLKGCTLREALGGSRDDSSTLPFAGFSRPPKSSVAPEARVENHLGPAAGGRLVETLTLFRLLCAPLAYLHGEGTMHRDIKPSNVFVRSDGTPVIMDFGLVGRFRDAQGRDVLADAESRAGTAVYMAPERVRGEPGDARSDLYSLGCTLYEALTGSLPVEAARPPGETDRSEDGKRWLRPSELVTGVPPALDMLVSRLLEADPRERIGHADDVAQALAAQGARDWPKQGLPRARSYLYQPRLIGREPALDAVLQGVSSSKKVGGLLLVGGESGVGKTARQAALVS